MVGLVALLVCALSGAALIARAARPDPTSTLTLSIVGTTDLHGYFTAREGRGGIGVFAGYINNLRAARRVDDGGVVLLDAGDTFQGGVESDLSEGAAVVDAYNALGYTALAIGNHEFDFGAADRPGARQHPQDDPQGAVKARAAQAHFPFLAANLLDASTGRRVDWPNVHPSTLTTIAGVKVGVVGIMTAGALRATLPLNVRGLAMAPPAVAVREQAEALRAQGATVVIVSAHAGGYCGAFDNPRDLSSCDDSAEIFDVARAMPPGLVDAIVAGHTHAALAHVVNDIPIVQAWWGGRGFGRIDLQVDRTTGRVTSSHPIAPVEICARTDGRTGSCAAADVGVTATYEQRPVVEDAAVLRAMAPALARVKALQDTPLGPVLEAPLPRTGDRESPLGNLFADALRERTASDVAMNTASIGGLRTDLPSGPITFGRLYDTFPFDNRLVRLTLTVDALQQGIANTLRRGRRGAFGISGVHVQVNCATDGPRVRVLNLDGTPMDQARRLTVAGMDSLFGGQYYAPSILGPGALAVPPDAPIMREVVEDWLRERGQALQAATYLSAEDRRMAVDPQDGCLAQ